MDHFAITVAQNGNVPCKFSAASTIIFKRGGILKARIQYGETIQHST